MSIISHGDEANLKSCPGPLDSEMKGMFKAPVFQKPTPTRNKLLEQFLWQEIYDEYVRHFDRLGKVTHEKSNSEYYEEYCKKVPEEDQVAKEVLMNRYPLHCTCAITVYNQNGDITKDFKRRYKITRPVDQQTEQFG